uniref:Protein O-mannosyl-transferase 2 (Trinotate prediction) n=1 Tax=Myxobolus squamalis TaxID=59785 RepID=A0A6B2FWN6_MYXSQ
MKKIRAKEIMKISFIEKFIESHDRMFTINKNLVPKAHEITSQPWQWPLTIKGIHFSILSHHRVYMLGNPMLYWAIVILIPAYAMLCLFFMLQKTGRLKINHEYQCLIFESIEYASRFFVGWMIHYFPYFLMRRVLYFHHYMPAYLFYSMFAGDYLIFDFRNYD